MANAITNTEDTLDSRDILERIDELREEIHSHMETLHTKAQDLAKDEWDEAQLAEQARHGELQETLPGAQREAFEPVEFEGTDFDSDDFPLEDSVDIKRFKKKHPDAAAYMSEELDELELCLTFVDEFEDYAPDWSYGATLISEEYFVQYCCDMLADIGAIPKDLPDYVVIDWESTADNLKVDYTTATVQGTTWSVR